MFHVLTVYKQQSTSSSLPAAVYQQQSTSSSLPAAVSLLAAGCCESWAVKRESESELLRIPFTKINSQKFSRVVRLVFSSEVA
jgi:hypothetical protein